MVTFLAGGRIRGTNAERLALINIQSESIFEETDTNRHYIYNSGNWTEI